MREPDEWRIWVFSASVNHRCKQVATCQWNKNLIFGPNGSVDCNGFLEPINGWLIALADGLASYRRQAISNRHTSPIVVIVSNEQVLYDVLH